MLLVLLSLFLWMSSAWATIPTDGTDATPALTAALAALPDGGTLQLPAGRYLLDSPLVLQRSVTLQGAGSSTVLYHQRNLATSGAANLLRIGGANALTTNVRVMDLQLEGPSQSALRTPAIRIAAHTYGVLLTRLHFQDISSSCVLILGPDVQDITIRDNTATEFYEQFVELASGGIRAVLIADNTTRSTRGHPALGATEPFGVAVEAQG